MQAVPQALLVFGHWQEPPEQTRLPVQVIQLEPHVPLLQTHALLAQCLLAPHAYALPHPPQLLLSLVVFAQVPLQPVQPAAQQTPFEQLLDAHCALELHAPLVCFA